LRTIGAKGADYGKLLLVVIVLGLLVGAANAIVASMPAKAPQQLNLDITARSGKRGEKEEKREIVRL
jgi:hypothetical protein